MPVFNASPRRFVNIVTDLSGRIQRSGRVPLGARPFLVKHLRGPIAEDPDYLTIELGRLDADDAASRSWIVAQTMSDGRTDLGVEIDSECAYHVELWQALSDELRRLGYELADSDSLLPLPNDRHREMREKIRALVAQGLTQEDIARNLVIGLSTLKRHLKFMVERGYMHR
jgi:hypothetical protein